MVALVLLLRFSIVLIVAGSQPLTPNSEMIEQPILVPFSVTLLIFSLSYLFLIIQCEQYSVDTPNVFFFQLKTFTSFHFRSIKLHPTFEEFEPCINFWLVKLKGFFFLLFLPSMLSHFETFSSHIIA